MGFNNFESVAIFCDILEDWGEALVGYKGFTYFVGFLSIGFWNFIGFSYFWKTKVFGGFSYFFIRIFVCLGSLGI